MFIVIKPSRLTTSGLLEISPGRNTILSLKKSISLYISSKTAGLTVNEHPLANFRRSVKVVNSRAEVVFENEEGEMDDIFQDEMPFDINAPIIEIPPEDYGIWFVDSMDHPDRYVGKTVHFKARALKPRGMGSKFFVPGRTAMTCCADDTTFLGYICKSAFAPKIAEGQWVEVTAKVAFEKRMEYQGEGIVLYAEHVEVCEPLADEMVYFN
mgnify:CR=1 FL=1